MERYRLRSFPYFQEYFPGKQADFYLDINHHQELMQAVRQAFENEMLTVGFENTVHDRHFIAPENIYAPEQVEQMVQKLKRAASDRAYLRHLCDRCDMKFKF